MSGVWGWFGGGAAQKKKDSPKNAILGLRAQLDMLQKREKHLSSQIDEQDSLARKHVNSNKAGTCFPWAFTQPLLCRMRRGMKKDREYYR